MQEIVISGVVDSIEKAEDPIRVSSGSGNVVGNGWGAGRRGRLVTGNENAVGAWMTIGEDGSVRVVERWPGRKSQQGDDEEEGHKKGSYEYERSRE